MGYVSTLEDDSDILLEFLLRIGDNTLILSHRISEWCGQAPILEEDIALANIALDLIGHTQMWLGLAAITQGKGKTADDLAFLRDCAAFRNVILVEQPNGDFGRTLMRQFLFDAWHLAFLEALTTSANADVAGIATKARNEVCYHLERSAGLIIRLGDGTAESHRRMQNSLDDLFPFAGELFLDDDADVAANRLGISPLPSSLRADWDVRVVDVLGQATLRHPGAGYIHRGGRRGIHSEHLGHLLASLQFLQRAYPGAAW